MSREHSEARIAFLRRASGPDIPALAFKLAYLIAFKYMNQKTWTAFPSQETLRKDLPADVRTVRRMLAVLQPVGLAIEPGRGRGNVAVYRIENRTQGPGFGGSEKADTGDLFSSVKADTGTRFSELKADSDAPFSADKTGHLTQLKPDSGPPLTNIREPIYKNPSSGSTCASSPSATKVAGREIEIAFEEWWKAYPRKVEKKGAKAKWTQIIKRGEATAAELLAGAKAYALQCVGKDIQYVKHPTTWLNNGCWADERGTAPKQNGPTPPDDNFWRERMSRFVDTSGDWVIAVLGPKPGQRGCRVPAHILTEFSIRPP